MGWDGDMKCRIDDAKENLKLYPKDSLGWYLAAVEYNNAAWEVCDNDPEWFYVEVDEFNEPIEVEIPSYNMNQILIKNGKMEIDTAG